MIDELKSFGLNGLVNEALSTHEFLVESYQPRDPACFGNALLVTRSPELLLRLVRDRDDVSVDFAPSSGERWIGPRYIITLVAPALICEDGIRLKVGLEETLSGLLNSHWPEITARFEANNLDQTFSSVDIMERKDLEDFLRDRVKNKRP